MYQSMSRASSAASGRTTLWMGELDPLMDEAYIKQVWFSMGEQVSVKMIRDKVTGACQGYCFIDFASAEAARNALNTVNGMNIPGTQKVFRLNWASGGGMNDRREDRGPEYSVFVGDLSAEVTDQMLYQAFQPTHPSLKSAKVVMDPQTGVSRGYGFVRFHDETDQVRAMSTMNGVFCGSRPMRISVATPKNRLPGDQQHHVGDGVPSIGAASMGPGPSVTTAASTVAPSGPGVASGGLQGTSIAASASTQPAGTAGVSSAAAVPPADPSNTTVFVGGLHSGTVETDLRTAFAPFGEVHYIKIPPGKGCGFVQYATHQQAVLAIQSMQGQSINGCRVRCSWGRASGPSTGASGTAALQQPPAQQTPQLQQAPQHAQHPQQALPVQSSPMLSLHQHQVQIPRVSSLHTAHQQHMPQMGGSGDMSMGVSTAAPMSTEAGMPVSRNHSVALPHPRSLMNGGVPGAMRSHSPSRPLGFRPTIGPYLRTADIPSLTRANDAFATDFIATLARGDQDLVI